MLRVKKLYSELFKLYNALSECIFSKKGKSITYDAKTYDLDRDEKGKLRFILFGYWVMIGLASFVVLRVGKLIVENSIFIGSLAVLVIYNLFMVAYGEMVKRYLFKNILVE